MGEKTAFAYLFLTGIVCLLTRCPSVCFSCGPSSSGEMVSRRKILSRSRDDLNLDANQDLDEEDVWYQREKLFRVSVNNPERALQKVDKKNALHFV